MVINEFDMQNKKSTESNSAEEDLVCLWRKNKSKQKYCSHKDSTRKNKIWEKGVLEFSTFIIYLATMKPKFFWLCILHKYLFIQTS